MDYVDRIYIYIYIYDGYNYDVYLLEGHDSSFIIDSYGMRVLEIACHSIRPNMGKRDVPKITPFL